MHGKSFNEYYMNNKGIFYKHYDININNTKKSFDIYWGDPDIIFGKSLNVPYPLAFIKFPKWAHEPDTRIYLHEKIELKYSIAFEYILSHEIGHFCLFDIFGINHPMGDIYLNEIETEIWADYFSYLYFRKYRGIIDIEQLEKIFIEIDNLQNLIYNIPSIDFNKYSFINKMEYLRDFPKNIESAIKNNDQNTHLMLNIFDKLLIQINELA